MESETLTRFAASSRGSIVQPGDLGYDDARKLDNPMIDRRPKLIAFCIDAADVIAAVAIQAALPAWPSGRPGARGAGA